MSDLNIPVWNTRIEDKTIDFIINAFNDRSLSTGKYTSLLEKKLSEIHQSNYVVCVNSGTSALKCLAIALGLRPGDEVIIPRRSWVATLNGMHELGLKIKFVDIDNKRSLICPRSLSRLLNSKTKAVIAVNLNGRNSLNEELLNLIRNYSIPLIQDNAQALLSSVPNRINGLETYQIISFAMNKLLTTGQGGCVITTNEKIAKKVLDIRTQGLGNIQRPLNWEYGSNYRISDLLSSIGLSQLEGIQQKKEKLIKTYKKYKESLENYSFCEEIFVNFTKNEFPLYSEYLFESRDELVNYLDNLGIETRPFYKDLDTAIYIHKNYKSKFGKSIFSKKGLTLPGGDNLSEEDQNKIIESILYFYKSKRVK